MRSTVDIITFSLCNYPLPLVFDVELLVLVVEPPIVAERAATLLSKSALCVS